MKEDAKYAKVNGVNYQSCEAMKKIVFKKQLLYLGTSTRLLLLSKIYIRSFCVLCGIGQVVVIFYPRIANYGAEGLWFLFGAPMVYSLYISFPRLRHIVKLRSLDVEIEVVVGDILAEGLGHIVIGSNDYFDTELPVIINERSVQGQYQCKYYKDNQVRLDAEIEASMKRQNIKGTANKGKRFGKKKQYPIGSVVTLGGKDRCVFLLAFAPMRNDKTVLATKDDLWKGLTGLWQAVRSNCQLEPVSVPILGKEFGRIQPSSVTVLAQLIILSYVLASSDHKISNKLSVVIYHGDYQPMDMENMNSFLKSIKF